MLDIELNKKTNISGEIGSYLSLRHNSIYLQFDEVAITKLRSSKKYMIVFYKKTLECGYNFNEVADLTLSLTKKKLNDLNHHFKIISNGEFRDTQLLNNKVPF
jgi:hypothetical protein